MSDYKPNIDLKAAVKLLQARAKDAVKAGSPLARYARESDVRGSTRALLLLLRAGAATAWGKNPQGSEYEPIPSQIFMAHDLVFADGADRTSPVSPVFDEEAVKKSGRRQVESKILWVERAKAYRFNEVKFSREQLQDLDLSPGS